MLLKKRNVGLQEQVTLLEKAVQNLTKEKQGADSQSEKTENTTTGTIRTLLRHVHESSLGFILWGYLNHMIVVSDSDRNKDGCDLSTEQIIIKEKQMYFPSRHQ